MYEYEEMGAFTHLTRNHNEFFQQKYKAIRYSKISFTSQLEILFLSKIKYKRRTNPQIILISLPNRKITSKSTFNRLTSSSALQMKYSYQNVISV